MSKYHHPINSQIAITYIVTNKKLTAVAALGITLGLAVYIFMNSMMSGFEYSSSEAIFKSFPHIRIYKDDVVSEPLLGDEYNHTTPLIINPKIVPQNNTIINPKGLVTMLEQQADVTVVTPQITVGVFYNNGKSQISGQSVGIYPDAANQMFDIKSFMAEGDFNQLKSNPNGIVLGAIVANKMNVRTGDNISLTSSKGITKVMRVVGVFQTNNSNVDKSKSYININYAQQLLKENTSYITEINVNIKDYNKAPEYAARFSALSNYKAEDWQAANETLVAGSRMRAIVITAVSFAILLVAGFGIYNILNMTVSQKINDIAILKAMGFKGRDVIRIFVQQALLIGLLGIIVGVLAAILLIHRLSGVYIGGDIGYFPVRFELFQFAKGVGMGFFITFLAGYIPARKAANVDPVTIFRK